MSAFDDSTDDGITHLPQSKIFGVNINQDSLLALFKDGLLQLGYRHIERSGDIERCGIAVYQTPECASLALRHLPRSESER